MPRLAAKLHATRASQRRTQRQIDATQARLDASTVMLGRIVRTAYQSGSLSEWAAVLGSSSPRQLASGIAALQSSSRAQAALLLRLGGRTALTWARLGRRCGHGPRRWPR